MKAFPPLCHIIRIWHFCATVRHLEMLQTCTQTGMGMYLKADWDRWCPKSQDGRSNRAPTVCRERSTISNNEAFHHCECLNVDRWLQPRRCVQVGYHLCERICMRMSFTETLQVQRIMQRTPFLKMRDVCHPKARNFRKLFWWELIFKWKVCCPDPTVILNVKNSRESPFQLYEHKNHKSEFEHSEDLPASLIQKIPATGTKPRPTTS